MFDKLLNIGCAFDWITPGFAFIQDIFFGSYSDFGIPAGMGIGRREIKRYLNHHGIRVWGLMYDFHGEVLMFTVENNQAAYTYYLLRSATIPVLYVPDDAVNQFR